MLCKHKAAITSVNCQLNYEVQYQALATSQFVLQPYLIQLWMIKTNRAFCNPHGWKLRWGLIKFTYKNMRKCLLIQREWSPDYLLIISCQHPLSFTPSIRLVSNSYLKWIAGISIPALSKAGNHNKTIGQLWTSLSLIRMSQSASKQSD